MNMIKSCSLAIAVCCFPVAVTAQISPDGSTSTTVVTNGNVSTIEGGLQAGGNLFHSFNDFSVLNGNEAYFNNAANIDNILSRVTGGNVSNIDGLIRANGSANLFLINPAGILFNDGARLDVGGSFYGSTADSILFPQGVEFSASNPVAPVLSINAPIGLNLRNEPGSIAINNSNIGVSPGQSLNLVGGEISLNGSNLNAPEGTVNLGSVATAGTVSFTESDLNFSENLSFADITLSNGASVNVNQGGSGAINVKAQNLTLADRSILNGGIDSLTSNPETRAGDVTIELTETLALRSGSLIRNNLSSVSSGNAGNIAIAAKDLAIDDGSRIVTITQGSGNTGNIDLDVAESISLNRDGEIKSQVLPGAVGNGGDINLATDSLTLTEKSLIFSNVSGQGNAGSINLAVSDRIILDSSNLQARIESGGIGNSGDINITTDSLVLRNTSQDGFSSGILTSTAGTGNAGNIMIREAAEISLEDASSIQTQVQPEGVGTGGNIEISTGNLSLTGNSIDQASSLLSNSSGNGDAGNIIINASNNVTSERYGLILSQATAGQGDAGDVTINSQGLFLNAGSYIISNTGNAETPQFNSAGNAGNVTIDSSIVKIDNFSQITSNTLANAEGNSGNISITNADTLSVTGGSNINSLTENSFDGGAITVNANNIELATGGKIITATSSEGNAGNVNLNVTEQVIVDGENALTPTAEFRFEEEILQNLEQITGLLADTTNLSTGDGGNVLIANPDRVSIRNGARVAVDSQGRGAGGNLVIEADSFSLDNGSQLIAETEFAQPQQRPSNIILNIDDVVTLDGDSTISARAFNNANGGNVTIDTEFIVAFPAETEGNDIVANASEGSGGNINITAEEIFGLSERKSTPGNMTNDLDVSSDFGFDGNLSLNTPDVDATEGVRELSEGAIAAEDSVQQACSANSVNTSSLSLQGRGNIPKKPTDILSSDYIVPSNGDSQISENNSQELDEMAIAPIDTARGKIYPARGLKITETGAIILTRSTNNPRKSSDKAPRCLIENPS